jgi:hypothetical protein
VPFPSVMQSAIKTQDMVHFHIFGFLFLLGTSCATARLVGPPPIPPPNANESRTVVIEPFFESAEWQNRRLTEYVQVAPSAFNNGLGGFNSGFGGGFNSGFGGGFNNGFGQNIAVTRDITEKPYFAKPETLVRMHESVLRAVQRMRPNWRVTSTSGVSALVGGTTVVRTVVGGNTLWASDRGSKNLAFFFGLVLLPLQIWAAQPVHETLRIYGAVERVETDASDLKGRLVRYPSQPDYAVSFSGLTPLRRQFGLDIDYDEGLLADERPRNGVLVEGFVERLAVAIVALCEEKEQRP